MISLLERVLVFDPTKRIDPYEALAHGYFDELRDPDLRLPNGNLIPDLMDFSPEERSFCKPEIMSIILNYQD